MSQPLAGSQNQPLRRRIHRHVGRLLNDVEALEVRPHRMRRVGHASVREGVGREQITELIIPARRGNSKDGDQGNAKSRHQQPDRDHGRVFLRASRENGFLHIQSRQASISASQLREAKANGRQGGDHQDQLDELDQRRREAGHVHRASDLGLPTSDLGLRTLCQISAHSQTSEDLTCIDGLTSEADVRRPPYFPTATLSVVSLSRMPAATSIVS